MSESSSSSTCPAHLKDLSMADLKKRRVDQIAHHDRLIQALYDDYPEYDIHVLRKMPIRPMTMARSWILSEGRAVQKELSLVNKEIERRKKEQSLVKRKD